MTLPHAATPTVAVPPVAEVSAAIVRVGEPLEALAVAGGESPARRSRRARNLLLAAAIGVQLLGLQSSMLLLLTLPFGLLLVIAAAVTEALQAAGEAEGDPARRGLLPRVLVPLGVGALGFVGTLAAAWVSGSVADAMGRGFHRGRQVRVGGKLLLPEVAPGEGWAASRGHDDVAEGVPAPVRATLAERWRRNGQTEHASVAAFAKLSLDLIAAGAPPELLAAACRDADDEIRHAEACFALARALDGRAEGPAAFPEALSSVDAGSSRQQRLASLAVDSLLDGALYEGVSARIVAKLARRARVPSIAELLRHIAADEGRHAAHAWDVVEWCVAEGGAEVAHALEAALARVPRRLVTDLPEAARDGAWEPFGIHGEALEASEHEAALAHLEGRVASLLASWARRAA